VARQQLYSEEQSNKQTKQEQTKKRKLIKENNKMESFRIFSRGMCTCFRDNENENGDKNLYAEPPVPVNTRRVIFFLPKKKKRWRLTRKTWFEERYKMIEKKRAMRMIDQLREFDKVNDDVEVVKPAIPLTSESCLSNIMDQINKHTCTYDLAILSTSTVCHNSIDTVTATIQ